MIIACLTLPPQHPKQIRNRRHTLPPIKLLPLHLSNLLKLLNKVLSKLVVGVNTNLRPFYPGMLLVLTQSLALQQPLTLKLHGLPNHRPELLHEPLSFLESALAKLVPVRADKVIILRPISGPLRSLPITITEGARCCIRPVLDQPIVEALGAHKLHFAGRAIFSAITGALNHKIQI